MQRIIDAQPEISINAWTNAVVGGAARSAGGVGRKDEILETLDKDRSLLQLLVDVSRRLTVDVILLVAWNTPAVCIFMRVLAYFGGGLSTPYPPPSSPPSPHLHPSLPASPSLH